MKRFKKEILSPLYFIHERVYQNTYKGYIKKDSLLIVLRQHYNIPRDECPVWVKSLEKLGLIKEEGEFFKVSEPKKSRDELILEHKKI
ncbi:MAG: hypothetical protein QXU39_02485 [Candidatus Pacearchaeota archaeon]